MSVLSGTQVTFLDQGGLELIGEVLSKDEFDDDVYNVKDEFGKIHQVSGNEMEAVD